MVVQSITSMKSILLEQFKIDATNIKQLDGLENTSYLVETETEKYIFKTYPYIEHTLALVEAENNTLLFLHKQDQNNTPNPIPLRDRNYTAILNIDGAKCICRMLSYLDGKFFGDVPHTIKLFQSFGKFLAQLDLKLQQFTNYTIKARQLKWDILYLNLSKKYLKHIPDIKDRNTVYYFFKQFEENVLGPLPELRTSIIHNDASEWNVLITHEEVSGIIDFGDLTHSLLINELAVAITYSCYDKENPLEWASILLKSYHEILLVEEKELEVLYYLIAARLCISVCISAYSRKENPNNEYAFVSEKFAWQMLYRWLAINPVAAETSFRQAAGFPAKKPFLLKGY